MKISRIMLAAVVSVALSIGISFAEGGFEVKTLDGRTTTLPEHFDPGKWTLVMVWSTHCSICRTEYPGMSDFHDRHKDTDAKVLGISVDGYDQIDEVREYVKKSPMTFDSLVGEPVTIASLYKTATEEPFSGTPTYLMFNPRGELVAHNPGRLQVEAIETYIRENAE